MTQEHLELIDLALAGCGGLIVCACAALWFAGGRRDPLAGAPLRPNRLSVPMVWLCVLVYFVSSGIGAQIAAWLSPPGLEGDRLRNWQGVFAANFAQVVNTGTCLLIAYDAFTTGLCGLGLGRRPLRADLGWIVGGWLVALFLTSVLVYLTGVAIKTFFPDFLPPEHGVFQSLQDPGTRLWMKMLAVGGAFILAPVGEEVFFRGILQTAAHRLLPPRRRSLRHRWTAIALVGSLFGAVHLGTPQFIPALMLLGMLFGYLHERTGSLAVPILVHMLFNGKSLLWAYLHTQ